MLVTTLIVEDEPASRAMLRDLVGQVKWLDMIGEADDGAAAVTMIEDLRPGLVFLDIQLPELNGLEVLRRIKHEAEIVFTTAYDEYAVTAFELGALDYLLKPFGSQRFQQTMARAWRRLSGAGGGTSALPSRERAVAALARESPEILEQFFVRDSRGRILQLDTRNVSHLSAADDYVEVHVDGQSYLVHLTLNEFERRLDRQRFRRVHRSHIVNLSHVRSIERIAQRWILILSDGSRIGASRKRSHSLSEMIL